MYPTRLIPMAVPVAAGASTLGNWVVAVASVLGLLVLLLAVRSLRLRLRDHATTSDRATGRHRA